MRALITISILTVLYGPFFQSDADTYLQEGLALEEQGQPVRALNLWKEAVKKLDVSSVAIAIEYLRVAAEHELIDYYHSASAIYMNEMSGSTKEAVTEIRSDLEKELLRLEPIMDGNEFSACQELFNENDPELFKKIMSFWANIDPTPDTAYNERMIEHWQRIVYSKEMFTRANEEPYGTDDRGRYYVKYGEPDKTDKGRVQITYDNIQSVLNQLISVRDSQSSGGNNFDLMKVSNRIQNLFLNPEGENLVVHFELYALQPDSSGMSYFEVAYEITPKSGLLGWTKRKRDEFNITLSFDNFGDRFAESLEIDAEGLEPDEYELSWTVRDMENGRVQEQQFDFEVFESSDSILSTSSDD